MVNVPLCTAASDQQVPKIISDGAGGAIITWHDGRGASFDIYAQRVNAAGVPQWAVDGVALCAAPGTQYRPTIASDGAGGALVTWEDLRSGTNSDIYVQWVNAAGVPQWTADGVALCAAADDQLYPTIVSDGAGGAIVTWDDLRSGTDYEIYAQRVNAAGVPQWTADGVALCTSPNNQFTPTIASDGAGGAIVAWYDYRSGTSNDIYAQRVNAAGAPQWIEDGVPLCTAEGDQQNAAIASDGASGAIVTWEDYRDSVTKIDIYTQRVNAAGVPQWTADCAVLCIAANFQITPAITPDGLGGAIVTWQDRRDGIHYDIYAQRMNATGVAQWTSNGALCSTAGNQLILISQNPMIVSDGAGGAIVAWFHHASGSNVEIYAQRMNAAGLPQWAADGVALCTAVDYRFVPTIASDGAGGAIVAWQDHRSGTSYDIYAQNINADGTLGGVILSAPPVSVAASFCLRSIQPNPSFGNPRVSFSLLDATPATLVLYDLTGRRIESLSVGSLGPGAHVASLGTRVSALPPGIYCVSLTQGSHRAFSKVAIIR
jgi:hypothetical protein